MYKQIHEKDVKSLFSHIKNSAKRRNIPFDLTLVDLNNLTFPVTCPVLSIPLYFNVGMHKSNSVSIDRVDSTKGYTNDNIVVVSNRANKLKSDATNEELQLLADFYN